VLPGVPLVPLLRIATRGALRSAPVNLCSNAVRPPSGLEQSIPPTKRPTSAAH
jgi:hypothetical protein